MRYYLTKSIKMAERSEDKIAKQSFATKILVCVFWREASLRAFKIRFANRLKAKFKEETTNWSHNPQELIL